MSRPKQRELKARRRKVARLRMLGLRYSAIASRAGCSRYAVARDLRALGLTGRGVQGHRTVRRAKFRKGEGLAAQMVGKEMAAMHGVRKPRPPRVFVLKRSDDPRIEVRRDLVERYRLEGLPLRGISDRLLLEHEIDISYEQVRLDLRARGIG